MKSNSQKEIQQKRHMHIAAEIGDSWLM